VADSAFHTVNAVAVSIDEASADEDWAAAMLFEEDFLHDGDTPLYFAARLGHAAVVAQLLEAGVGPAVDNEDGRPPVELARAFGAASPAYELLCVAWCSAQERSDIREVGRAWLVAHPSPSADDFQRGGATLH
jgi:hypothetical protein